MKEFTWRRYFVRLYLSRPVFTFEFGKKGKSLFEPYRVYGLSIGSYEMSMIQTNTGKEEPNGQKEGTG